jgi:GDP-D-mannose dehydratase
MWLMLQQEKPEDYVIATGETHSVKEFVELAFEIVGLKWENYIEIDKTLFRPAEVFELRGDIRKIKGKLKWQPKVKFSELVRIMVENDLNDLKEKYKK